jgi:FtsH-binding integral membrane protein
MFGILVLFVLYTIEDVSKGVPTNYSLMTAFTFCKGYFFAFIVSYVRHPEVVTTICIMIAGILMALIIYTSITKQDFSTYGGICFILGGCFILYGTLFMVTNIEDKYLVYSTLGVIIYGMYLVLDMDRIVKNE